MEVGKEKLPFEDNSVDYVYSSHFIEHINGDDVVFFLEDLYRVCKNKCIIDIYGPHYLSKTSCRPYHKQYLSESYFDDFKVMDKKLCKSLDHKFYFNIKFEVESWGQVYSNLFPDNVKFELEVVK